MAAPRVIFSSFVFARQRYGGISRLFVELAERLTGLGVDVRYVAPLYRSELLKTSGHGGLQLPVALDGRGGGAAAEIVGRWAERLEALHRGSGPGTVWHASYLAAPARLRMPLVVTAHDMIHDEYPNDFVDADEVVERKRRIYTRADALIAVSSDTRNRLLERYAVRPDQVWVVPHGVDHQRFQPEQPGHRRDEKSMLYVGARSGYKNFAVLLQALASTVQLGRVTLRCFGGGPPTPDEQLMVGRLRLRNRIEFVGGNDSALAEEYRRASVYVCPSRAEGFGLPVLEAMASGCPVVTTSGGALPEVSGGAAMHVPPDDVPGLAAALVEVLEDASARTRLRERGLVRARQFSWERCAADTLAVYESLT